MKLSPIKKVHRQVHKKKLGQGSDPMSRLAGTWGLTPVPDMFSLCRACQPYDNGRPLSQAKPVIHGTPECSASGGAAP